MLVACVKNVNRHRNLTDCIFTFCHFLFDMPGTDLDDVPRAAGSGRMVKCLYRRGVASQAVCSEALWFVFPSPFERAPKGFRSCSEGLRNNPPPQYLPDRVEGSLPRSNLFVQMTLCSLR